jgi:hypothetical protein
VSPRGTLRVDELILPVVDIRLRAGELHIIAVRVGVGPAASGWPVVHGVDGTQIIRGVDRIDIPARSSYAQTITVDLPIRLGADRTAIR